MVDIKDMTSISQWTHQWPQNYLDSPSYHTGSAAPYRASLGRTGFIPWAQCRAGRGEDMGAWRQVKRRICPRWHPRSLTRELSQEQSALHSIWVSTASPSLHLALCSCTEAQEPWCSEGPPARHWPPEPPIGQKGTVGLISVSKCLSSEVTLLIPGRPPRLSWSWIDLHQQIQGILKCEFDLFTNKSIVYLTFQWQWTKLTAHLL